MLLNPKIFIFLALVHWHLCLRFAQILVNGTAKEKHGNLLVIVLTFYRLIWCGCS